ncbi:hypothetical protein V6N11_070297 [Hibiscus sabdariffa]|uniref:Cytochrome P450 n=1 Tax=Hibiscus sabdariffa TaxID=183260 RepID=A0ABR2QF09_9ROSI
MASAVFMNIFLLALPFFLFILLKHRISNNGRYSNLPPSPPALPFIGHLHMLMLDNSDTHVFLWRLSKKYGPLMSLRFGSKLSLVVSSAKMAEEVMKTHDLDFCSRPNLRGARRLSYDALDLAFSPYTDYWKEVRKICVVHLFSRVHKYRSIREDEVARLVEKIRRLSVCSKPVNLSEAVICLTSSIICRVGFGRRYDEEEGGEGSRFHGLLEESEAMFSSFSFADYFPFMGWADRFTGFLTRLERTFKELDTFYQQLIDEHLDPSRSKPEQEDIVDVLLRIRTDPDFPFDLTIDHIKAILMVISHIQSYLFIISFTLDAYINMTWFVCLLCMQNVFIAGTDTVAVTVIWVMTFLMKNPSCLDKTQAEVRDLVGGKGFVNEDDVQGLTYLKAVIKETFRLQPADPLLLPRETLRECSIGGYQVQAETLVYVNIWAIGRDPETWENPEQFCPERFIGNSIDYKGMNFELIPFGAGRRVCPGMRMGVAEVELALANLLYKFDWEMPTGMSREDIDLAAVPGIAVHKKNDLVLLARKIGVSNTMHV